MPKDRYGQQISFAIEVDTVNTVQHINIRVSSAARTIQQIAANRGHPEMAFQIAQMNGVRSVVQKLRIGRTLKIPGILASNLSFDVHPQDEKRPIIKDGYAIFQQAPRFGEKSITQFMGYNALAMDVYIQFEGWQDAMRGNNSGGVIEDKIRLLERMAGRGPGFKGAASGPPAIVRVSCTDNFGAVVPLIPLSFQWDYGSAIPGLRWYVGGIDWDDGARGDDDGQRVRSSATVHLFEVTPLNLSTTAVQRAKVDASSEVSSAGNALLGALGSLK